MVITTTDIQLFQILKQKIGEQEAEALVTFVDAKLKETNEANLKILSTKEDIANLKSEMLKWMIGLFVPLYLTIIGLFIILLLKH